MKNLRIIRTKKIRYHIFFQGLKEKRMVPGRTILSYSTPIKTNSDLAEIEKFIKNKFGLDGVVVTDWRKW